MTSNSEKMSSFMDAETTDPDRKEETLEFLRKDRKSMDMWYRFHVIRDCLHGDLPDNVLRQGDIDFRMPADAGEVSEKRKPRRAARSQGANPWFAVPYSLAASLMIATAMFAWHTKQEMSVDRIDGAEPPFIAHIPYPASAESAVFVSVNRMEGWSPYPDDVPFSARQAAMEDSAALPEAWGKVTSQTTFVDSDVPEFPSKQLRTDTEYPIHYWIYHGHGRFRNNMSDVFPSYANAIFYQDQDNEK
jgi:negative regulator of sigma E activity